MRKTPRAFLLVGLSLLVIAACGCAVRKGNPGDSPGDKSPPEEETSTLYSVDERDRRIEQLADRLEKQTRLLELRQQFLQGLAYESLGEYSRAIDSFQEVRDSAWKTPSASEFAPLAQLRIARIYRNHMDSPSRAESAYRTFLDRYPDHPDHGRALVELGRMYQEQGQFDAAVEVFETFVHRYPSSDGLQGVYYNLGVIHLNQDEPAKAVKAFRKMLSAFPEGDLADGALFRMGQAHNKLGEIEAQLQAFTRVLNEHPESDLREFVMYRTVQLALELDRTKTARRWAKRYQKEYPEGRYGTELEKRVPPDTS